MVLLPHSAFIGLEGFYIIESADILHDYHNVPLKNASSMITATRNYKQLLDEVFVISRIIEVEVGVISRSRRLRLITLTETSIILNITKTESNNCFIIH